MRAKIGKNIVQTPSAQKWENLFRVVENFKGTITREQPKIQERVYGNKLRSSKI